MGGPACARMTLVDGRTGGHKRKRPACAGRFAKPGDCYSAAAFSPSHLKSTFTQGRSSLQLAVGALLDELTKLLGKTAFGRFLGDFLFRRSRCRRCSRSCGAVGRHRGLPEPASRQQSAASAGAVFCTQLSIRSIEAALVTVVVFVAAAGLRERRRRSSSRLLVAAADEIGRRRRPDHVLREELGAAHNR